MGMTDEEKIRAITKKLLGSEFYVGQRVKHKYSTTCGTIESFGDGGFGQRLEYGAFVNWDEVGVFHYVLDALEPVL